MGREGEGSRLAEKALLCFQIKGSTGPLTSWQPAVMAAPVSSPLGLGEGYGGDPQGPIGVGEGHCWLLHPQPALSPLTPSVRRAAERGWSSLSDHSSACSLRGRGASLAAQSWGLSLSQGAAPPAWRHGSCFSETSPPFGPHCHQIPVP